MERIIFFAPYEWVRRVLGSMSTAYTVGLTYSPRAYRFGCVPPCVMLRSPMWKHWFSWLVSPSKNKGFMSSYCNACGAADRIWTGNGLLGRQESYRWTTTANWRLVLTPLHTLPLGWSGIVRKCGRDVSGSRTRIICRTSVVCMGQTRKVKREKKILKGDAIHLVWNIKEMTPFHGRWSCWKESNLWRAHYECAVLPTELQQHVGCLTSGSPMQATLWSRFLRLFKYITRAPFAPEKENRFRTSRILLNPSRLAVNLSRKLVWAAIKRMASTHNEARYLLYYGTAADWGHVLIDSEYNTILHDIEPQAKVLFKQRLGGRNSKQVTASVGYRLSIP